MKAIGGYFEIEDRGSGTFIHNNGVLLNTGRNALEYILRSLADVKSIYLPYFTCEVVLEPILKLGIPYRYYHINNQLEIAESIELEAGQYLIANNYFGIKDSYIRTLSEIYGTHLIVDCAQAFFAPVLPGINTFYSARKFVGVPDGGIAYCNESIDLSLFERDYSLDRTEHLYIRKEQGAEAGFKIYQSNELQLDNKPILCMSDFTKDMLNNIDYKRNIETRRRNFEYIHSRLADSNLLTIPSIDTFSAPMVYPYINKEGRELRHLLIGNKVFVARYWPNVLNETQPSDIEYNLTKNIISIPIDQRYSIDDMKYIIKTIQAV